MKKYLLILILAFVTINAFAQNYRNGDNTITFGIAGGSSSAGFYNKAPEQSYVNNNIATPISFGLNADIKFNDYFSIRPSVFYQGKGGTINEFANYDVDEDYKLHYFEIPVDFIGHLPVGDNGANIFAGGGPFFSIGLNGTNKRTINQTDTGIEKITFGSKGDFKSTDFGATMVLGFQTASGTAVGANFELGLTNILNKSDLHIGATSARTGVFYLSVGQSF